MPGDVLLTAAAVTRRFGGLTAVDRVSLELVRGEVHSVIGTNGAGKSTLVNILAGELSASSGEVHLQGREVTHWPQPRRARAGIGRSYQRTTIFPRSTVFENCRLAAQAHHQHAFDWWNPAVKCTESTRLAEQAIEHAGLSGQARRVAGTLSHGQKRQLEIAMCLATAPQVLLLDEPLANLDPIARKTLRIELARLHRDLAVTTIHATRDAADALALSDRLAVLHRGRVLQVGEPAELYQHPRSREVAEALGPANFLTVRIVEVRDLGVVVETDAGQRVPVAGLGRFGEGTRGLLVLRPALLSLAEPATARGPGLSGTVALRVFEGARHLYEVDIGGGASVRVEVPLTADTRVFRLGDRVRVELSSETVALVPADEPAAPAPA